jgi:hypothetical protein
MAAAPQRAVQAPHWSCSSATATAGLPASARRRSTRSTPAAGAARGRTRRRARSAHPPPNPSNHRGNGTRTHRRRLRVPRASRTSRPERRARPRLLRGRQPVAVLLAVTKLERVLGFDLDRKLPGRVRVEETRSRRSRARCACDDCTSGTPAGCVRVRRGTAPRRRLGTSPTALPAPSANAAPS